MGRAVVEEPPPPQDVPLESDDEEFREPDPKRARRRSSSRDAAEVFGEFSDDEDSVARALILCGVAESTARSKAKDIVSPSQAIFFEMYGRGEIVREANASRRDLNVVGLEAMDLRTSKPDGTAWDFTLKKDRRLAMQMIDEKKPYFVIGSPMHSILFLEYPHEL